jgi:hypothetical protein
MSSLLKLLYQTPRFERFFSEERPTHTELVEFAHAPDAGAWLRCHELYETSAAQRAR